MWSVQNTVVQAVVKVALVVQLVRVYGSAVMHSARTSSMQVVVLLLLLQLDVMIVHDSSSSGSATTLHQLCLVHSVTVVAKRCVHKLQ